MKHVSLVIALCCAAYFMVVLTIISAGLFFYNSCR